MDYEPGSKSSRDALQLGCTPPRLDLGPEPRPPARRPHQGRRERVFEEKKSGKAGTRRPAFEAALAFLRPDDVLVIWKLDQLGRWLVEMMRTIDGLRRQSVHFRSLTEQFDSDTPHGRFALQMHGAMAEYFLDLNCERTMEGLRAALARGRKGGRPKALSEADLEVGRALLAAGNISVAEITKRPGVSSFTFYSYFPQAWARGPAAARKG